MAAPVDDCELVAGQLEPASDGGLMLVSVDRPADVPKALGWLGPVNYDLSGESVSAVLRSWEDRFGATLVGIGFDTLTVQVGRSPQSDDQVSKLVTEHYAFCPDNIEQGMDLSDYTANLPNWSHWQFWWD